MAIQELRTFKNLQDAVISRGKLDENKTEVRNLVKEYINTFYQHLGFKRAYGWSGESRPLKLRARYNTGTLTLTNDSDIITGVSTSWNEFDHLWCHIKIGSEANPYKIIRVASTTSITVDHPYTGDSASSVTYEIYRDEIGLFPDLQSIRSLKVPGVQKPVDPIGPDEMDKFRYQSPFRSGTPRYYTVNGYGIYTEKTWADFNVDTDFWEDNYFATPRNKKLIIWPGIVTTDTISQIRYTRVLPPMNADDDEPLLPYESRRCLVLGPLMEHFLVARDAITKREWEKEYKQLLKELEGDVESVDSELIFQVDRRSHRRETNYAWSDEELTSE